MREAMKPRPGAFRRRLARLAARAAASPASAASTRAASCATSATGARCAAASSRGTCPSDEARALIEAEPSMLGRDLAREVTPAGADRRRRGRRARAWSRSTPASRRSIVRNLASAACRSTLLPCTTARRRGARARARRRVPRQRPGRPGGARLRRRQRARAGREGAGVRASASATSCCAGRSASRPSSCPSATAAPTTRSRTSRPGKIEITAQNHGFAVRRPGGEQHGRR